MDYVSIFDAPKWSAIGLSAFQTATLFVLVLIGLKLVGRRVFGEKSPQDLIIILLLAEACDLGLSDERAGYWGTVASVVTILFLGWLCEKIKPLRRLIESAPITLFEKGRLHAKLLDEHMMDETDLQTLAREYGLACFRDFETIVLEGDGKLTGVPGRNSHLKAK